MLYIELRRRYLRLPGLHGEAVCTMRFTLSAQKGDR
jgi:hypothetical protein